MVVMCIEDLNDSLELNIIMSREKAPLEKSTSEYISHKENK